MLQSLILLAGPWGRRGGGGGGGVGLGDGTPCPKINQSLSKHTTVLLLLQLETWLDGEEGILLEWSQLHFISIRKFSRASVFFPTAQTMNNHISSFLNYLYVRLNVNPQLSEWTLDGDRSFSRRSRCRNRWCPKLDDRTFVLLLHLPWLVSLLCSPAGWWLCVAAWRDSNTYMTTRRQNITCFFLKKKLGSCRKESHSTVSKESLSNRALIWKLSILGAGLF